MDIKFLKKIADLKKETGKLSKDSKNPFFNSKYFDINQLLEHLEPILDSKNLLVLQPIIDGKVYSKIIDLESGESIESFIDLPQNNDPQKIGSAITYFRRYSLQSLLGLQAEDDDGNKASSNNQSNSAKSTKNEQADAQAKEKPWLNLTDKNGEPTEVFKKLIARSKSETITVSELKKYFKISKEAIGLLAKENIN